MVGVSGCHESAVSRRRSLGGATAGVSGSESEHRGAAHTVATPGGEGYLWPQHDTLTLICLVTLELLYVTFFYLLLEFCVIVFLVAYLVLLSVLLTFKRLPRYL